MSGVLHVITGLGLGGAESVLVRTAIAEHRLGARKQTVVSLMDDGVYGAELRAAGIAVHCLGMRRGRPSPIALLRLSRLMRRTQPDVVMSWLYHADLAALLASIFSGIGLRRLVWNLRCSDMDLAPYRSGTKWVLRGLVRLSPLPGAVAANSRAGQEHHRKLGYRPRRWVLLPNGFDTERWRPDPADRSAVRGELGVESGNIVIGMVARADPMKDHATFFAAAELLAAERPDVRFVLIGEGTGGLRVPAALRGKVTMLGERSDVPRLVRAFDISVLSSMTEGFPNVVAEAMASGVPCVSTDAGDAAAIIGETGVVVPPRSPGSLARALERLASMPAAQRDQCGEAARQRIADHYSLTRVLRLYENLWEEIGRAAKPAA